mgnify:CR=1 FL=1
MFNKFLKITLIGFVWTRYGRMILSTLMLFVYFWVVGLIHQDYLDYLKLQGNGEGAGWSFVLKWLAFFTGIVIFWFVNNRTRKKHGQKGDSTQSYKQGGSDLPAVKSNNANRSDDPFDAIRRKSKLRSKADMIIQEKNKAD